MTLLQSCLHDLTALGLGGLAALLGAMFVAGVAGGATHCAMMCAPFVLTQVAAGAPRTLAGGTFSRLAGAALLPYHAGRLIGYAALGGLAGGLSGLVTGGTGLRAALALPLGAAALLMLRQAAGMAGAGPAAPRWLGARVGRLLVAPGARQGVLLGLLLSALPCGLLYAALAGAAASASALAGALAMAAFVLGTVPALVGVGLLGRLFLRGHQAWLRPAARVLLLLNALLLGAMAVRLVL